MGTRTCEKVKRNSDGNGGLKEAAGRVLGEGNEDPSFGIEVSLSGEGGESDASTQSAGALLSVGVAFLLAAGMA